jgi:hypothetical protein
MLHCGVNNRGSTSFRLAFFLAAIPGLPVLPEDLLVFVRKTNEIDGRCCCLLIGTKRSPSAAQGPLENPRVHSYVAIPFVLAIVIVLVGNPTPTPSEAGLPLVPRVSHGTAETRLRRSRRRQMQIFSLRECPFQQEFHPSPGLLVSVASSHNPHRTNAAAAMQGVTRR